MGQPVFDDGGATCGATFGVATGGFGGNTGDGGISGSSWLELGRDGETELLAREPGFQRKKLHPLFSSLHYKKSMVVN